MQDGGFVGHASRVSPVQTGKVRTRHPGMQTPILSAMHRGSLERHPGRALLVPGVEV